MLSALQKMKNNHKHSHHFTKIDSENNEFSKLLFLNWEWRFRWEPLNIGTAFNVSAALQLLRVALSETENKIEELLRNYLQKMKMWNRCCRFEHQMNGPVFLSVRVAVKNDKIFLMSRCTHDSTKEWKKVKQNQNLSTHANRSNDRSFYSAVIVFARYRVVPYVPLSSHEIHQLLLVYLFFFSFVCRHLFYISMNVNFVWLDKVFRCCCWFRFDFCLMSGVMNWMCCSCCSETLPAVCQVDFVFTHIVLI